MVQRIGHWVARVALVVAAIVVAGAGGSGLSRSAAPAAIVLTGTVTSAEKGTYQEHAFEVPAGVTRIDVEFTYQNRNAGTELEIGMFDAQRFRGTSRFSKDRFHLGEFEATPSYVPGPLTPGRWRLSLGIPAIAPNTSSAWRATIGFTSDRTPPQGLAPVLKNQEGWYVGDLHAHTLHSDGFGCSGPDDAAARGCQPWEVVEAARARKLDFLAITDHNTTSHHADLATLQEGLTSLLLLRGQELTTFRGHANVYGTSRPIDFRLGFRGRSIADVLRDVGEEGGLLSINHPGRDTGDRCTGCGWDAPNTPWDRVEVMEVVNGGVIEGRTAGMPFWYARLNEGHRITGIGGSDDHGARSPRSRIGSPATIIHAAALSEAALIDGLRTGRVYVRTRGPEGPAIDLAAKTARARAHMGGTLPLSSSGERVELEIAVERASGQQIEIVRNGDVVAVRAVEADGRVVHILDLAPGQWVHVRLRHDNQITAFTNPLYGRRAH